MADITGTAKNDVLDGTAGDDTIAGLGGNDTLNGGAGHDILTGGAGSDTYIVDGNNDTVVEDEKGGIDTVIATFSHTLADNVENLILSEAGGNAAGIGNDLANVIAGNGGDNFLRGFDGNDTLVGGGGNDIYQLDAGDEKDKIVEKANGGHETVFSTLAHTVLAANLEDLDLEFGNGISGSGNALNNAITGNGLDNLLDGGAGDDRLDGGTGADTMKGGAGRDLYIVDNAADQVIEGKNQGVDEVDTSLNAYTLGDTVENLRFIGAGNFTGTGNALDNAILGGAGNDVLNGGAGNDQLRGNGGSDVLNGGDGDDFLDATAGSGSQLVGGKGNDFFQQDGDDTVLENANEGIDTIRWGGNGDYTLEANVENLELNFNIKDAQIHGNELNNVIHGSGGGNSIDGAGGNDTILGGSGNDTLSGGDGNDTVNGGEGDDTLNGDVGDDLLLGGDGNDALSGNAGKDTLQGGAGDDRYLLNAGDEGDKVVETGNGGVLDTVEITFVTDKAYLLVNNVENLVLHGNATKGLGNALDNEITGGDTGVAYQLDGGAGRDFIRGNNLDDTLIGGTGNDGLIGNGGDDTLEGGAGGDALEGGAGADTMSGGAGNDFYSVESAGDVVIEGKNQGDDTVLATISYTLGDNVEVLEMFDGAVTGTGNALNNVVSGNSAANTISGLDGNDLVDGGGGNDVVDGGKGNDEVFGLDGDDHLFGGDGNDTFDLNFIAKGVLDVSTSSGIDDLHGGKGDDSYFVTNAADQVFEAVGEGKDLVIAFTDYTLAAGQEIERLTLYDAGTSSENFDATGNEFANTITGNKGANTLAGGGGSDTLIGGDGDDTYVLNAGDEHDKIIETGKGGFDDIQLHFATPTAYVMAAGIEALDASDAATTVTGNSLDNIIIGHENGVSYQLDGGAGRDHLEGAGGDDFLSGGAGDDFLRGGGGADHLAGGAGEDFYFMEDALDTVTEAKGGGTDTISAGFNFDLATKGENVENLLLTGNGNFEVKGNALNNEIHGNEASNVLNGEDGNDRLFGHGGNDTLNGSNGADRLQGGFGLDTLTGGAGADTFVFSINHPEELPDLGSDTIADFQHGQDKIDVSALFDAFQLTHKGNPITDGHLILTENGDDTIVQFDADGAGGAAPVTLATVIGVHVGLTDILH